MDNVDSKRVYLITCISCMAVLVLMCYFGVNNSMKGTSAADSYNNCSAGKTMIEYDGNAYCCPADKTKIIKQGDNVYCYKNVVKYPNTTYPQEIEPTIGYNDIGEPICLVTTGADIRYKEHSCDSIDESWTYDGKECTDSDQYLTVNCTCYNSLSACAEKATLIPNKCYYCGSSNSYKYKPSGYQENGTCTVVSDTVSKEVCETTYNEKTCYYCKDANNAGTYSWDLRGKHLVTAGVCGVEDKYYTNETDCKNGKRYSISYNLKGGKTGEKHPTIGHFGEGINIDNPTKRVGIVFSANNSGATFEGDAEIYKDMSFKGWSFDGDTSIAEYGLQTGNQIPYYKWTSTLNVLSPTFKWFRNLGSANSTVTMTANWETIEFTMPTINAPSGTTCAWGNKDGTGTVYTPGKSYSFDLFKDEQAQALKLFINCGDNLETDGKTVAVTIYGGVGKITKLDNESVNLDKHVKSCKISSGETSCSVAGQISASLGNYTFTGWGDDFACTQGKDITEFDLTKDISVWACFKENFEPYMSGVLANAGDGYISYVDGINDLAANTKTHGQGCQIYLGKTSCTVGGEVRASLSGYTFKGWDDNKNCNNPRSITVIEAKGEEGTTAYACYTKNASPSSSSSKPSSSPQPSSSSSKPSSSSQPSSSKPSSSSEPSSNVDDLGNVNDNSGTGDIAIFLMWVMGLATLVYSIWYFKRVREN